MIGQEDAIGESTVFHISILIEEEGTIGESVALRISIQGCQRGLPDLLSWENCLEHLQWLSTLNEAEFHNRT